MRNIIVAGVMLLAMERGMEAAEMCSAAAGEMAAGQADAAFTGVVLATTNASRYTYVQINTGKETLWAAGPAFEVKIGDRVSFSGAMLMKSFTSRALGRKFDELYMCGSIVPVGSAAASGPSGHATLPAGHPALAGEKGAVSSDIPVIKKPDGGKTVAEIWAGKAALADKQVVVRAKVMKVSRKILGMNWLHLRDGSGVEGQNDLVVTTKDEVQAGDVITVSGTVHTDRDLGSGYRYDVIVENATVVTK